ncbi:proline--tRNA ligase, partial [Pseudomonas syringae]
MRCVAELRNVVVGVPCSVGKETLVNERGIDVGQIFQLSTKNSDAVRCQLLCENGKPVHMAMGCYCSGVSRVVAADNEQNCDENGNIWIEPLAPFLV